jgi:hypothetical protein
VAVASSCCSKVAAPVVTSGCGSSDAALASDMSTAGEASAAGCCGEAEAVMSDDRPGRWSAWSMGLRFAFVTLPKDIAVALLLGALLAGLLTAVLTPEAVSPYLGGWWAVPVMALVGLPVYICSTGVIPLALAIVALGGTPGSALTLMIAGPAANAATWSIAQKTLGFRSAVAALGVVALGAVLTGWAVDLTGVGPWLLSAAETQHLHEPHVAWWGHVSALALIVMLSQRWWPVVGRVAPAGPGEPTPARSTS